ncbi:MAG: hypothetical protein H6716_07725 [Polyangiaceae bacterium]|nr:hypothetical protein [Polyangiaceae bacterium]
MSTNGRSAVVYDVAQHRIGGFLEHIYRARSNGAQTRDFAYDSYPGVRVGGSGSWLGEVTPSLVEYEVGTGIIHVRRDVMGLRVDEYIFAPTELGEHAYVDLVRVERTSGSPTSVDGYLLYNFHMGSGAPEPASSGETIVWQSSENAFMEWGPSGAAIGYGAIATPAHHGASPSNPYGSLQGGNDLADNAGTNGTFDDAVGGLQWSLGTLNVGDSAWFGGYAVVDSGGDVLPRIQAVRSWIAGRSPQQLLEAERAEWQTWHASASYPSLQGAEKSLFEQSMAILRMGQVREPGRGNGQILASLPTGMWNISWVRDMAYAVVALARAGHLAEAKAALEFQLGADSGHYQTEVGVPYQISITRYFGDGVEETDFNEFGPNIEFDGFGLFLWTLHEYLQQSSDLDWVKSVWADVSSKVADPLLALQEPSGLIAADSSIWEVHWQGQQKHFAYTTLTAANGLCRAATMAEQVLDTTKAAAYRDAGSAAQNALLTELRAPDHTLAQSLEELQSGSGFLDAAAIEAVGFGLLDPQGESAKATLASMRSALVPASGRGFFRNDDGGWYDSQEWVFVDLRTAYAMRKMQDPGRTELISWITDQASENYRQISELHDATSADYRGENPMVGFGAGAYSLALMDREAPQDLIPCGTYAEGSTGSGGAGGSGAGGSNAGSGGSSQGGSAGASSGGMSAGATGGGGSAGTSANAGAGATGGSENGGAAGAIDDDSGCGCRMPQGNGRGLGGSLALLAGALLMQRRRRLRNGSVGRRA